MKSFKTMAIFNKFSGLFSIPASNRGEENKMLHSQFAHVTFTCPMEFRKFPLDTQVCNFRVGSYGYAGVCIFFPLIETYCVLIL